jgi:hypothetical protein
MKRTIIAVALLLAAGLSSGCNKGKDWVSPDGTKMFGDLTLQDGTRTLSRIEFPDGTKHFDVTTLPDGSAKIGRIEFPNGEKDFDAIVVPPDGSIIKVGRDEFPDGQKQFNKTRFPDGTQKIERVELPSGEKHFDVTISADDVASVGHREQPNAVPQLVTASVSALSGADAGEPTGQEMKRLQFRLYLFEKATLQGGMSKQELEKLLFSSERVTNDLAPLVCSKPYANDARSGRIRDLVKCQTTGTVERGTTQIPVMLLFDMGLGSKNAICSATESFPVELADDARGFLTKEFGEPSSYGPTSWKISTGCSEDVNGVRTQPPGRCASIALRPGNFTNPHIDDMDDWETMSWEDWQSCE